MPYRRRRWRLKFFRLVVVLSILVALASLGLTWFMHTVCLQLYNLSGAGLEELLQKEYQKRQKR